MKESKTSKQEPQKAIVDEDYLMNIMSGDVKIPSTTETKNTDEVEPVIKKQIPEVKEKKSKKETSITKYQELFLVNDFPSTRAGKVVYIRPEYHEVLLRITQLSRKEKTTLYSYLDNILKQHLKEYSLDITQYFNEKFKPIL